MMVVVINVKKKNHIFDFIEKLTCLQCVSGVSFYTFLFCTPLEKKMFAQRGKRIIQINIL
jgi:hypothetical protein